MTQAAVERVVAQAEDKARARATRAYHGLVAKAAIAKKRGYSQKARAKLEIARVRALAECMDLEAEGVDNA